MTSERWKRMEDLFHAAEAQPPGERESFLARECSDDESLRRDVASLLEQSSRDGILSDPGVMAPPPVPDLMLDRYLGQLFRGYRLQSLLGAGGMGEVYLAHDTRLGRDVAVKVLPQEFTSDPDRLARFEREARMLATLNHPNICGIYGLEEADGIRFLVLELVEGQTLAARLREANGPIDEQVALEIARQIAEALDVAHERGVIHRDLKPSNVKITPTQIVKVLDFGLAKSVAMTGAADDLTQAAAGRAHDASGSSIVMGTAAYMSPEQARGLAVDKRTDVWAFGVVLFEMVSGTRPFRGETATDTLASILKTDPDWAELPPTVHPGVRRLLHRCLQKDPKRRLQSIADARVEIETVIRGGDDDPVVDGTPAGTADDRSTPVVTTAKTAWTVAAVATAAALTLATVMFGRPDEPPFHFAVPPPAGASLATEESPLVSPDGLLLAFVGYDAGGTQRLYVGPWERRLRRSRSRRPKVHPFRSGHRTAARSAFSRKAASRPSTSSPGECDNWPLPAAHGAAPGAAMASSCSCRALVPDPTASPRPGMAETRRECRLRPTTHRDGSPRFFRTDVISSSSCRP